jgi:hypothetical protein
VSTQKGKNMVGKLHILKIFPEFFERVLDGSKPFEIRYNDRELEEYKNNKYTGREVYADVTYVLDSSDCVGLEPEFVALGLELYG